VSDEPVRPAGSPPGPPQQSLHEQAVVGFVWAAAQKWLVRISTLLAFILLGRLLTPEEFGVVALAMTIITVLTVLTDAGFTLWLIQHRRLNDAATSTAFWISGALGLVLAGALAAAAGPVADLFDSAELRVILPVLALSVVVAGLSSVPAALLQREMRFRDLAIRQVVATVASVVVAVVLALLGAGVWALVAQTLVRVCVATVILWWKSDFRPRFVFSLQEARAMTGYGAKSLGVALGGAFRDQGEAFMIGALVGTTALGFWTIAGRLVYVVVELGSAAVGSVAAPLFAKLQDDPARLTRAYSRTLSAGSLILVPAMVALALSSRELVPLVFGPQWVASGEVAGVLAGGMLFTGLGAFHRAALLGVGRAGAELWVTVIAITGQVLVVVLLSSQSLVVIAAGLSTWAAVTFVVRAVAVRITLGIGFASYHQLLALLLAGGAAAATVLAVDMLLEPEGVVRLVWVGLLGGTVFVLVGWLVARPTFREVLRDVTRILRRRQASPTADPTPDPGPRR